MKRHVQQTGIRQWAGEDLLELQTEPLKALDGFFAEYGNCVIEGCDITDDGNGSYSISGGLVALSGLDAEGKETFKVVGFSGVDNVSLPVYMTLAYSVVERAYMDNKVKPIAYDYRAVVSAIKPEEDPYLELSQGGAFRFVDVIQNSTHRFMTDSERTKLNGIEASANRYVHPANHPASMISEDATHRFLTDAERTKLKGIESGAIKYIHPEKHPAAMITEDTAHRFVSDSEKNTWSSKAAGNHNHDTVYQPKGSYQPAGSYAAGNHNHDTVYQPKGSYQPAGSYAAGNHNHDTVYQPKGSYQPAGNYQPAGSYAAASHGHSAGDVSVDATHRFVTDTEKSGWNSKAAGNHNHSGVYQPAGSYAAGNHNHDAVYQPKGSYQPAGSYAAGNHNHDTVYQPKGSYQPAGNYQPAGSYAAASHGHSAGDVSVDATHRFVTDTEKSGWNSKAAGNHNHSGVYQPAGSYAAGNHNHDAVYQPKGSYQPAGSYAAGNHNHDTVYQPKGSYQPAGNYQPAGSYAAASHGHSAGDVSVDATHRFVTDAEKASWNGKASGSHNHSGVYQPAGSYAAGNHNHDTVYQPKGSYQPAGSYAAAAHTHSASQVAEETNKRFMTDAERSEISTLGTYAKADFSNITSKSMGQNGYYKLPDGLLIQWGYASQCGNGKRIYFPVSFYYSSYNITFGVCYNNTSDQVVLSAMFGVKVANYFDAYVRYVGDSGGTHGSTYPACWIAIGRWK